MQCMAHHDYVMASAFLQIRHMCHVYNFNSCSDALFWKVLASPSDLTYTVVHEWTGAKKCCMYSPWQLKTV